jgi:3-phenylpropionate/trans-cinnamate dioxygenase ferredoxin subunit
MTRTGDPAAFVDVAAASDVAGGELLGATLPDGTSICLYNHDGEIGAVGGICTHAEFAIADGTLHGDGTIECVWHGARFDCRTGAARRAPAVDPLPIYAVRVERGRVLVSPRSIATGARP